MKALGHKVLGHVVEDVDDVVVVLEALEEAVDVLLLLVGTLELVEVFVTKFRQVAAIGADEVFHLPHVEQVFCDVLLSQLLCDIHKWVVGDDTWMVMGKRFFSPPLSSGW